MTTTTDNPQLQIERRDLPPVPPNEEFADNDICAVVTAGDMRAEVIRFTY